eukprot:COSAG06_NODE_368_length_16746_cov_12.229771_6_plen_138_part_00
MSVPLTQLPVPPRLASSQSPSARAWCGGQIPGGERGERAVASAWAGEGELTRIPFAQRQSAAGEAGCGDAPQPVKLAKTARINTAHIMVMSRAVVCVEAQLRLFFIPCTGYGHSAVQASGFVQVESFSLHLRRGVSP